MANYELSNRIYELRKQKNLSQKELGAILGVSNKAVSKWETGSATPKTETLIKLAEVFEISPEELLKLNCEEAKLPTLAEISIRTVEVIQQEKETPPKEETPEEKAKSAMGYLIASATIISLSLIFIIIFAVTTPSLEGYVGDAYIVATDFLALTVIIPLFSWGLFTGLFCFFKIVKKFPAVVCVICGILFVFLIGFIVVIGLIMIIPCFVKSVKILLGKENNQ